MIYILEVMGLMVVCTLALCIVIALVYSMIRMIQENRQKMHDDPKLTHPQEDVPLDTSELERDIREMIAQEFEIMSAQRNPDDPERSALYSKWAMNAADRIRNPERYSGSAKNDDPWNGIPLTRSD